ncbi:SgcJ/EcaC family oxidoreductase [Olivibacter sp. XZL3]|uniref:YybH family protein n=1 Tax=Olivibacter sp. XZL3 TaxID=1735116 RepID=UPI0014170EC8|nr:SgcJ/EcaC family oxidoreductase [Olivibacter sp. XZL3]
MNQHTLDVKAIQEANRSIYQAFETLDFNAAGEYLTEDCDYITAKGMRLKGRAAYIRAHKELMNNAVFKGAKVEGDITDIRFLNEKTVVVIARESINFRWRKKITPHLVSINTSVWVKELTGKWKMTAFHNCRIQKKGWLAKWLMRDR